MAIQLRPWSNDDIEWWVALRRRENPEFSEDQLRRMASGSVARFIERVVAVDDGRRVGVAAVAVPPLAETANAFVLVEPEARGRGVGSALWRSLSRSPATARDLDATVDDDDANSVAIVESWGFVPVNHGVASRLSFGASLAVPVPPAGVRVRVGTTTEFDVTTIDQMLARSATHPEAVDLGWVTTMSALSVIFPEMIWVIAEVEGVPAAATSCVDQGAQWLVVYTGADPAYRGRGLARLLKQTMHAEAQARGATSVFTVNEESNTAVRALNAELGYERVGGEIRFRRSAPESA